MAVVNRMKQAVGDARGRDLHDRRSRSTATGRTQRKGVYTTNGALLSRRAAIAPSASPCRTCSATPCSPTSAATSPATPKRIRERHDCLTWVVLKGHTNNRGGSVTLTSPDPRARPAINFRYFEEGTDAGGDDLQAVVEGIRLVAAA